MSDDLIKVPAFLAAETGDYGVMPACDFCKEVACETAAMSCGQCSGQSCGSQCSAAQCGQCGIAETGCGPQCFQCGTCESCQSSECKIGECILCETGQCGSCEKGCQSSCERNCQGCEGCESACERSSQNPSSSASLSIEGGPGELTWKITGLDKPFNTGNGYVRAGITKDRFTAGGVSSITGIIDYKSAPASGTATSVSHTISCEPGTYIFWGFVETKQGGYWPTGSSVTVTVDAGVERWDWSATAARRKAYSAVTSKGPIADFSYLVWNDLVDKVNEAAEAAGSSWSTLYATLSQTKMKASDKTLTAKRFNALRQNIGSHVSTGIAEVSKGDTVKGSWFVTLADKLNQWIDSL